MLAALTALAAAAGPLLFTSGAEAPQSAEQRVLPPRCALCPPGKVTCSYYRSFMVKEVDLGDIGAEVLAIVPRRPKGGVPPCRAERGPDELSVSGGADPWFGYFEGARDRFAFFRSADAVKGAVGFAVYDAADGRRVFEDAAIGAVKVLGKGSGVGLSFVRVAVAPCSPLAGGEDCWKRIKSALGLDDPAPDCAAEYLKANEEVARARCQGDAEAGPRCVEQELRLRPAYSPIVPPALGFEVEIRDLSAPEVRPAPNAKVVSCRPAD